MIDIRNRGIPTLPPVDEQRLWSHAEFFAQSTRLSGSTEELKALEYAQAELNRLGYSTQILHHKGYVSWPGKASLETSGTLFPCITHAMAADRPGGVTEPVVDLTGVSPAGWSRTEVGGRIAIAEGLASPSLVKALVDLGAAGAIFVNGEHTYEMIVSTVWGSPDSVTVAELPDLPVVSVDLATWTHLREVLARQHEPVLTMRTSVDTRWRDLPLLEARLPSSTGDEDFVLFSGHIDVWHLGAMDNGAANAAMLEVAAHVAEIRSRLKRGLRLAFWSGHSQGRYAGSSWYADQYFEEIRDHCVLHVNIDSVGGRGADDLSVAPVMAEAKDLARRAVGTATQVPFEGVRSERAGDQSFYGHGVSSLFMGLSEQPAPPQIKPISSETHAMFGRGRLGFGWWWHTTEDTLDKLDPARLGRDTRVYSAAVTEACCSDVIPLLFSDTLYEIREALSEYLGPVGQWIDVTRTFGRLEQLEEAVGRFESMVDDGRITPQDANRAIKALSRFLVPINYVQGSIFEHDPALRQPAVPSLALARGVEGLDEGGRNRLAVALRRRLNRIDSYLREALEAIEYTLASRAE